MTFAWKTLVMTHAAVSVVAYSAWFPPPPKLIWNASASVPIGLYRVEPADTLKVADLVVVQPPGALEQFLADGGYLPRGVQLLKRIVGLPGQTVCRLGLAISVDGVPFGEARTDDRRGRRLPVWQGCVTLGDGQVFLLNSGSPDSLDGRYFGPLPVSSIIGSATPLWTPGGPD